MKAKLLERIQQLENKAEQLRRQLGVSRRGELLFQAPNDMWSDLDVVVEADGTGKATLLVVEGNYPADYLTHREQCFDTEEEACEAAERMAEDHLTRQVISPCPNNPGETPHK
jgi:hypothetical protein